jgi:hypothetical protein
MHQLLPIIRRKRRTLIVEAEVKPSVPVAAAPVKPETASEPLEATVAEKTETQPVNPSEDTSEN